MRRIEILAFAAIAGLALVLRLALWLRVPADLDHLTLIDDTYLALHIARSIADGLGPLYGLAPTNGFQPLFVFAVVPAFWIWPHDPDGPLRAAMAMTALCDLATLGVLHRLVRERAAGRIAPLAAALAWAVNPYVLKTSFNGLETSIACLTLAVLLLELDRARRRGPARFGALRALRMGAWLGVAALARIDLLLMAPVIAWVFVKDGRRAGAPWRRVAAGLAVTGAATIAVLSPWWLYAWSWTGTVAQVSGHAVRHMELANVGHAPSWSTLYAPMLGAAGAVVLRWNAVLLLATGLAIAACLLRDRRAGPRRALRRLAPTGPAFGFGALLFLAYALAVFGHWHFPRYLFPLAVPFTLAFAFAVDALGSDAAGAAPARRSKARLAALAALGTASALVLLPPFARLFAPVSGTWGYRPIGEWARRHFPAGTRIGASQSGALGYFADSLLVVNLDGVVNRDAFVAMREKRALDYVRENGIRWLVWQDDVDWLVRETAGATSADIEWVADIPAIRTFGEPWRLYRVAAAPAQSSAPIGPPGAGPSAATLNRPGARNARAAVVTSARVTAMTRVTSSSIVKKRPR
jgi:hypothetical protein